MTPILFFDLDNTLLDFSWAEEQALRRTYQAEGAPLSDAMYARYHAINALWWQRHERGEVARDTLLLARHRQFIEEYALPCDPVRCEALYRESLGIGHRFMPHAEQALAFLKPRCRLFLATNGVAATQYARLNSAGILSCFEGVFISEELGANKPMPEFFARCFSRISGFRREDAAIVGDSLTSDIRGGINAGIRTIWYNPHGEPCRADIQPDLEIRDLLELCAEEPCSQACLSHA